MFFTLVLLIKSEFIHVFLEEQGFKNHPFLHHYVFLILVISEMRACACAMCQICVCGS